MSEVARLPQQIEQECEAVKRALESPAIVASHDAISHKYDAIEQARNELAQHIGGEAATEEMVNSYQRIVG